MPLKFTAICELFQSLENIVSRDPPYLPAVKDKKLRETTQQWFRTQRKALDGKNYLAVLSTLLPERRTDRVYGIQSKILERLVARCLIFGEEKHRQLGKWRERNGGDLGECVERIEKDFDCVSLPCGPPLSVEEVDAGLTELASRCRFSGPDIMKKVSAAVPDQIIKPLFYKMHSREKKWFVRLILKSMGRLQADWSRIDGLLVNQFHFLLPLLLRTKSDLITATRLLCEDLKKYPAQPDFESRRIFLEEAEAIILQPRIGVKVGRPHWAKARSFKNCLDLVGQGQWIIERKYDGEFVELHVDLSKDRNCIQIFSKNGRDSTEDRKELHGTLRGCLRIGQEDCKFKEKCILLGEMVVWSDLEQKVLGFEKLRKYVSRAGSFLGTEKDSQTYPYEHLMIVFFDVLMVDDEVTMNKPHEERRMRLAGLLTKTPGRAATAEWKLLDFSTKQAQKSLVIQFTAALVQRCEGLILKPNASYFPRGTAKPNSGFRGFIKLKKDYMTDMGGKRDVADFAVIGASYEVKEAQKSGRQRLRWTNFYLGCLMDDEQAKYRSRPRFKVVKIIKQDHCIPPKDLKFLNQHGQFRETDYDPDGIDQFDIQLGRNPIPDALFRDPFVVEVLGSAFEKPASEDFWMLRHPRILKIHTDRSWEDCITASGLAQMADEARNVPAEGESQEAKRLVEKLCGKMKRAEERGRSQQTTSRLSTTESPTSAVQRAIHHANETGSPTPVPAIRAQDGQFAHIAVAPLVTALHQSPEPCQNPSTFGTIHHDSAKDFRREAINTQLSPPCTQAILSPSSSQAVRWPRVEISPPSKRAPNANLTVDRDQKPGDLMDSTEPTNVPRPHTAGPTRRLATTLKSGHAQSTVGKEIPCNLPTGRLHTSKSLPRNSIKAAEQFYCLRIMKPFLQHDEPKGHANGVQHQGTACDGRRKQPIAVVETPNQPAIRYQSAQFPGRLSPLPTPISTPKSPSLTRERVPSTNALSTPKAITKPSVPVDIFPPIPRPSSRKENAAPPFPTGDVSPVKDRTDQSIRPSTSKPLQPLPVPSSSSNLSIIKRSKRTRTAVDDFDIDMVPRKIPKWGRPPSSPIDAATPSLSFASPPRLKHNGKPTAAAPENILTSNNPPSNLPFALPSTAILLAPSLHANTTFQSALTALSSSRTRVGALIKDPTHWRRDTTRYEPMGPVVGESQAWDEALGWRRVLFVDRGDDGDGDGDGHDDVGEKGTAKETGKAALAFVQEVRDVVVDLRREGYEAGGGGEEEARVWKARFLGRV